MVNYIVSTWDCITFGSYWQNDTNGDGTVDENDEKESIKWRVLSVDGDDAFIMSDMILDWKVFDNGTEKIFYDEDGPYSDYEFSREWNKCSLRTWLNSDFYNLAFTQEERDSIYTTEVPDYNYSQTSDKISLGEDPEIEEEGLSLKSKRFGRKRKN